MPDDLRTLYRDRRDRHEAAAAGLRRRAARLTQARLATFLGAIVCLGPALVGTEHPRIPWLLGAAGLFVAFAALVLWDQRLAGRIRHLEELRDANARGLARLARDFDRLPPCPPAEELLDPSGAGEPTGEGDGEELPAFVRDLHLFGHGSLFRLLSVARTPTGRRTLARWLAEPAAPETVTGRQDAVRDLAGRLDFRQELEAAGAGVPDEVADLERFYRWAEGEPWLARRPVRLWIARLLTLTVAPGLAAALLGAVPVDLWIVLFLSSYLFSAAHTKPLHAIYDHATAGGDGLRGYAPMFEHLDSAGEEAPGWTNSADEAEGGRRGDPDDQATPIARHMQKLERLTILSDTRRGLIHFFAQTFLLWDFHVVAAFETWQRQAGPSVRGWLDHLGRVEALCSLASLAHDHPGWAFPRVDPAARSLTGRDLGHPLIPDERCVGNDVEVGPPGTFLLVTGSNMSGKTTLIRAVGADAVLAQAGAPACAAELTLPPVRLATSVVVEDSLEEGVSFFMAELLRLKSVVDAAEEESRPGESRTGAGDGSGHGRKVLYLLDEVLRGTNSTERRVAVRRVLHRLLELDAIGAITTHDLELSRRAGERDDVADAAVPIHFRETVRPRAEGGAEMTFDFIARPGLAPTTNALRLLEAVGLGNADPESKPDPDPDGRDG